MYHSVVVLLYLLYLDYIFSDTSVSAILAKWVYLAHRHISIPSEVRYCVSVDTDSAFRSRLSSDRLTSRRISPCFLQLRFTHFLHCSLCGPQTYKSCLSTYKCPIQLQLVNWFEYNQWFSPTVQC